MALKLVTTASSSDHYTVGHTAAIDDFADWTFIVWLYLESFGVTTVLPFIKADGGSWNKQCGIKTSGQLEAWDRYSGTSASSRSANSAGNRVTTGKWWAIAFQHDATGKRVNLFLGDLITPFYETAYATEQLGTGTLNTDNTYDAHIWNVNPAASGTQTLRISHTTYLNRLLTLGELRSWQFAPRPLPGTGLHFEWGYQGTADHRSQEGNALLAALSGSASVTAHPPLPRWRRRGALYVPVSAASGLTLTPAGFDVGVAFGDPAIDTAAAPAGFDVAIALGDISPQGGVAVGGFDVGVALGDPAVDGQPAPAGLDIGVAFGDPTPDTAAQPAGFDAAIAFGDPAPGATIAPVGFDVGIAFGDPTLSAEGTLQLFPAGFDVGVALGDPAPDGDVAISGFDAGIAFGDAAADATLAPVGFDVGLAFGDPAPVGELAPAGFDVAIAFGTPVCVVRPVVGGFDVGVAFGDPVVAGRLAPVGFDLAIGFGSPAIASPEVYLSRRGRIVLQGVPLQVALMGNPPAASLTGRPATVELTE